MIHRSMFEKLHSYAFSILLFTNPCLIYNPFLSPSLIKYSRSNPACNNIYSYLCFLAYCSILFNNNVAMPEYLFGTPLHNPDICNPLYLQSSHTCYSSQLCEIVIIFVLCKISCYNVSY